LDKSSFLNFTNGRGLNVNVEYIYIDEYEHIIDNYHFNTSNRYLQFANITRLVTEHQVYANENYYKEFFNFTRLVPCNFTGRPYCVREFRNISNSTYSDHIYYKNDSSPDVQLLNITHTNYNKTIFKVYYNKNYNRTEHYNFNVSYINGTYTYNETRYIPDVYRNRTNRSDLIYLETA